MGQQQLLLLVLGIVLVGLAVAGGIAMVSENTRKSALDVGAARVASYAGVATAWRMTPRTMGGGQGEADSRKLGLATFGVRADRVIVEESNYVAGQTAPGVAVAVWYRTTGATGPTVEVWDMDHSIKSTLFLYGPTPQCQVYRHAILVGGRATTWETFYQGTPSGTTWNYSPDNVPTAPAGCTW